jgi:hypothetical protein
VPDWQLVLRTEDIGIRVRDQAGTVAERTVGEMQLSDRLDVGTVEIDAAQGTDGRPATRRAGQALQRAEHVQSWGPVCEHVHRE